MLHANVHNYLIFDYVGDPTEIAKNVYRIFKPKLVKVLPMKDSTFLAVLHQKHLLPGDLKEQVEGKSTSADKATYFLERAVECSLDIGIVKPLSQLLKIMSGEAFYDDTTLKTLAEHMKQELNFSSPISTKVAGRTN